MYDVGITATWGGVPQKVQGIVREFSSAWRVVMQSTSSDSCVLIHQLLQC